MPGPSPPLRRGPLERVVAWLVTGPLGHLWSVVGDIVAFNWRTLANAVRERLRRG